MNLPQQHPYGNTTKGFTLVELVIVIAMLGTLSAYAAMTRVSPSEMSLPSQAQTLASDIRRVQTLGYTTGNRMCLTTTTGTNGTYTARPGVIVNGVAYCSCAVVDGVTYCPGAVFFSVTLKNGITLTAPSTPLDFKSDGQPNASATYTLTYGGSTKTVTVAALTGVVTVTP